MSQFNYIAVEGIVGSGKTSLANFLGQKLGAALVLDHTQANPFLADFYANPARFSFSAQIFFLLTRYQQLKLLAEPDLFESKRVADYVFARDEIFARLNLNQREYTLYQNLYKMVQSEIIPPDLVIYLQTPALTASNRIRSLKPVHHSHLTPAYLGSLSSAFDQYFFNYNLTPLLIVNTDNLDLFKKQSDIELILSEVEKTTFGTRYFAPAQKDVLL
jgi:deoxyadenosine/deoxycytidine kinase